MNATFCITNKCNSHCIMCTNDFKFDRNKEEISRQQFFERIDQLPKTTKNVTLTGGEPTLNPDFPEILSYLNKKLPNAEKLLLSNGRMFSYKDYTDKIMGLKISNLEIAIPLCAHNEEVHDSITLSPGSFRQAVNGIKNLLSSGALIELRIVIHAMNHNYLEDMARFINRNFQGISRIVLMLMEIQGNGFRNKDRLLVKYSQVTGQLYKALDLLKGHEVRLYHFPLCTLKPEYWNRAWRSLEERKVFFKGSCDRCKYKKYCLGILKTYSANLGDEEFRPVTKDLEIIETASSYRPIKTVKFK